MTTERYPDFFEDIAEYGDDADRFLKEAKLIVCDEYNAHLGESESPRKAIQLDELYIVWFSKVLQNWKALVSTARSGDGFYFEVTFNGDKREAYVDTYIKISNTKIEYEKEGN